MSAQLDLETYARDEAIARAEEFAPQRFIAEAKDALRKTAELHATFIVDTVWEVGDLTPPAEARSMGAVMAWGRKAGLIAPTDRFIPSPRPGSHRCPRRVWRSLVREA